MTAKVYKPSYGLGDPPIGKPPIGTGPTGDYPKGKSCAEDEGGLQIAITNDGKGHVVIAFGTPVEWIAFDRKVAEDLAFAILTKARVL